MAAALVMGFAAAANAQENKLVVKPSGRRRGPAQRRRAGWRHSADRGHRDRPAGLSAAGAVLFPGPVSRRSYQAAEQLHSSRHRGAEYGPCGSGICHDSSRHHRETAEHPAGRRAGGCCMRRRLSIPDGFRGHAGGAFRVSDDLTGGAWKYLSVLQAVFRGSPCAI